MCKKKKTAHAVLYWLGCISINVQLAFSVLDELVEAVPGVVVLMHLKIVVKGLVNGFDARLNGVADDIRYTFGRFFDILEIERFIITVQQISLGEVLKAVGRE